MIAADTNLASLAFVLLSVTHSIVLMRVCMHVIDRVFIDKGHKDL